MLAQLNRVSSTQLSDASGENKASIYIVQQGSVNHSSIVESPTPTSSISTSITSSSLSSTASSSSSSSSSSCPIYMTPLSPSPLVTSDASPPPSSTTASMIRYDLITATPTIYRTPASMNSTPFIRYQPVPGGPPQQTSDISVYAIATPNQSIIVNDEQASLSKSFSFMESAISLPAGSSLETYSDECQSDDYYYLNKRNRIVATSISKTNIYIRGLDENTTDQNLYDMCEKYGEIKSTKAIVDKQTNKCKGYGFVDYRREEDAQSALAEMKKEQRDVQLAKQREQDPTNLYFANLPSDIDEAALGNMLRSKFNARVCSTRVMREKSGESKGVGFARVDDRQMCDKIIQELNAQPFPDHENKSKIIMVKLADSCIILRPPKHHQHQQKQQQQQQQIILASAPIDANQPVLFPFTTTKTATTASNGATLMMEGGATPQQPPPPMPPPPAQATVHHYRTMTSSASGPHQPLSMPPPPHHHHHHHHHHPNFIATSSGGVDIMCRESSGTAPNIPIIRSASIGGQCFMQAAQQNQVVPTHQQQAAAYMDYNNYQAAAAAYHHSIVIENQSQQQSQPSQSQPSTPSQPQLIPIVHHHPAFHPSQSLPSAYLNSPTPITPIGFSTSPSMPAMTARANGGYFQPALPPPPQPMMPLNFPTTTVIHHQSSPMPSSSPSTAANFYTTSPHPHVACMPPPQQHQQPSFFVVSPQPCHNLGCTQYHYQPQTSAQQLQQVQSPLPPNDQQSTTSSQDSSSSSSSSILTNQQQSNDLVQNLSSMTISKNF